MPALPVTFGGARLVKRNDPPGIGADTRDVLSDIGLTAAEIDALLADGVLGQDVAARRA